MQDEHKYHFDDDPEQLNQNITIRLDDINKKIKDLQRNTDRFEELHDPEDFLNAFDSEQLEDAILVDENLMQSDTTMQNQLEDDAGIEPDTWIEPQNISDDFQMTQENTFVPNQRTQPTTQQQSKAPDFPQPPEDENKDSFWNKKTIGLVAIAGMVAFLICFGIVQKIFQGTSNTTNGEARPFLVTSVLEDHELLVYDIQQNKQKTILLTEDSKIYNEANKEMASNPIESGDLVMVTLDEREKTALALSYHGIVQKEISGLQADVKTKKLVGEKMSYPYTDHTLFRYQEEQITPQQLESCDKLRLFFIQDTVWAVDVLSFHGYLTLEHTESVQNGTVILDDAQPIALKDIEPIALSEGTHNITISGDNIESRTDSFLVEGGEEVVYDLSKAQAKMGVLIINTNVEDYKLYINGKLTPSNQPAVLPLGNYDVVILKNGYLQWEKTVTLNADTITITAELEEDIQYGTLSVDSNPVGAHVMVDGVEKGVTPLQVQLPTGSHEVDIFLDGFSTYRQQIMIAKDTDSVITAVLE